jgi:RimJ/RimL family protein N-acetyltransferase
MTRREPSATGVVSLRDVADGDLQIFFEHQLDPDATHMAAFPSRDRDAHMAHWRTKILGDETVAKKTILYDECVAGNIVSWIQDGRREVGYWIGKSYWGQGVATKALSEFVTHIQERPLYAYVARHNIGSIRVLEKCGFTLFSDEKGPGRADEADVEGVLMELRA